MATMHAGATAQHGSATARHRPGARRARSIAPWALGLACTCLGCDGELSRITLYGPGEARATVELDAPAAITFKTNLEVEGPPLLDSAVGDFRYGIDASQHEHVVSSVHCDPLQVGPSFVQSRRASSTRIGLHRHSITEAPLTGCVLDVPAAGKTLLRFRLEQLRSSKVHPLLFEIVAYR